MSESAGKVLCWGDVGLDRYLDEGRDRAGGCALNVARSLILGGSPAVACAGAVGEDGRWLREVLEGWGAEVELLEVLPGTTPRQRIRLEAGERELCGHTAGVMASHDPRRLLDRLTDERLYVPCFEATLPWVEACWERGRRPWALDLMDLVDVDGPWIERALGGADVVFAGLAVGHPALPRLRALAREPGAALLVTTLGADGAIAFQGEREERVPAAPLPGPLVDTTGCGDAFAGTFLAGWSAGWELTRCLEAASRRAAQVAAHRGAVLDRPVS